MSGLFVTTSYELVIVCPDKYYLDNISFHDISNWSDIVGDVASRICACLVWTFPYTPWEYFARHQSLPTARYGKILFPPAFLMHCPYSSLFKACLFKKHPMCKICYQRLCFCHIYICMLFGVLCWGGVSPDQAPQLTL